ncbi:hypothetical protein [Ottowia sp.]|uniref:hypothetical protein n=1 Tax=Ottowia sp. TaxID=1898956 RepID=UPI0025ED756D|nr:hypothetical protein [Ottowia sp.]MBK6745380.1 hypothetical protein [Ottowia sp.]
MSTFNRHKLSLLAAAVAGLGAMSGAQAATLTCGPNAPGVRINTANKADWSTDARYVAAPNGIATIVDDYRWGGTTWFNPADQTHGAGAGSLATTLLQGKWLSFGATADETTPGQYPAVNTVGVVADGAWVAGRATFIYNEPITIGTDVDLSTIKIRGTGGFDNGALLAVKPTILPGGVANNAPWIKSTTISGGSWTSPAAISLDGTSGLGFYYGANTIGLALDSENTTATWPVGVVADFEITADCLTPVAEQPTTPLLCPMGNRAGDTIRIGPFTTNARDWKWTWRTNSSTAPQALENVEQPLFDDFIWHGYFKPAALPSGEETAARWISPGTTDPSGADIPGVPYPLATGQSKSGFNAAIFALNQPITVGNNVDLATIKLDGRFGFDDYGNSVFVQPAGAVESTDLYLPNGFGAFTPAVTPNIPGFRRGQNTIGLRLDGGQFRNDCTGGACALGAIADFYVTATCTGVPPILPPPPPGPAVTPVPTLDVAGLGLLGLLSAGAGALALRRRKRAQQP